MRCSVDDELTVSPIAGCTAHGNAKDSDEVCDRMAQSYLESKAGSMNGQGLGESRSRSILGVLRPTMERWSFRLCHSSCGRWWCLVASVISLIGAEVRAQEEPLIQTAISALSENRNGFGSIQVEWVENREIAEKKSVLKHRFWSREGDYYRMDSEFVSGATADEPLVRERVIVRPEGYARLVAAPTTDLAITATGTGEEGLNRLLGNVLFDAGIRGFTAYAEDVLEACQGSSPAYTVASAVQNGDVLELMLEAPGATGEKYIYEYQIDLKRGVCLSWKEELHSDGQVTQWYSVVKRYDEGVIPEEMVIQWKGDSEDGQRQVTRKTLKNEAAPLGLFSLRAQGASASSIWVRRLRVMATGLSLLGVYLVYRWRINRS